MSGQEQWNLIAQFFLQDTIDVMETIVLGKRGEENFGMTLWCPATSGIQCGDHIGYGALTGMTMAPGQIWWSPQ